MAVEIGARWKAGPAELRSTDTGVFWARNPPVEGAALDMQKALLLKPNPRTQARIAAIQQLRKST